LSAPTTRLALIALGALLAPAAPADTIRRRGGPPIARVLVTQDAIDGVRYRVASESSRKPTEQTLAASAVLAIEFDPAPESLRSGLALLEAGDLERAIEALTRAAADESRAPVAAQAQLMLARARTRAFHAGRGEAAAARDAWRALIARQPDSRLVPDAVLEQGRLLAAAGDGAGAARAFAELTQFAERHQLGPATRLAARHAEASAWLDLGEVDKADAILAELIAAAPAPEALDAETASIVAQARVARAMVPLARGQLDEAAHQLDALDQQHDLPRAARALAWIGLGEVQARRNAWAAAELQYTRVRVLHFDLPEACARATYDLGLALKAQAAGNAAGLAAAAARFREVLVRYGDTRYATLARRELS
jgi:outer membrane protein assembly factor BamD (BamD/ComL family)